jgi:hypothetical protein
VPAIEETPRQLKEAMSVRLATWLRSGVLALAHGGLCFSPMWPHEWCQLKLAAQPPQPPAAGQPEHPEQVTGAPPDSVERELWAQLEVRP